MKGSSGIVAFGSPKFMALCAGLLARDDHPRDQHGGGAERAVEAQVVRAQGDVCEHIRHVSEDDDPHLSFMADLYKLLKAITNAWIKWYLFE